MDRRALVVAATAAAVAVGVAGAASPPKPSPFDRHFLISAAEMNTFELSSAAFAHTRSQTRGVCSFATRLINAHRRSGAELARLAARFRMRLPKRLNPLHQWVMRQMRTFAVGGAGTTTGGIVRFDEGFPQLQAAAHRLAIREFAEAARVAEDPQVRSFARRTLPILRAHLKRAVAIEDEQAVGLPRCGS